MQRFSSQRLPIFIVGETNAVGCCEKIKFLPLCRAVSSEQTKQRLIMYVIIVACRRDVCACERKSEKVLIKIFVKLLFIRAARTPIKLGISAIFCIALKSLRR